MKTYQEREAMKETILEDIPFDVDVLMKRLRVPRESPHLNDLRQLVLEAQQVARPKAMYKLGYIESRGDETVVIDGVTFTSRVLRINLEHAHRVFLYVATCGREIHEWGNSLGDLLQQYWAGAIQEMALRSAARVLNQHIVAHHQPGQTATMAPGSLADWPLKEQRPLFSLLGDTQKAIGVQLSESLLMIPTKSVSGMRFPTQESFESCQLCPRIDCPGRRAPYDQGLYRKKYSLQAQQA
jgi:hypothetical protein